MASHIFQILQCQQDIQSLNTAKSYISTLRTENSNLNTQLSSLATSYTSEIKFEDSGSIEIATKNISSQNDAYIEGIESAINARISALETDIRNYQELDRREEQRRLDEARQNSCRD